MKANVFEVVLQQLPHMCSQIPKSRYVVLQQAIDMPQYEQLTRVHRVLLDVRFGKLQQGSQEVTQTQGMEPS